MNFIQNWQKHCQIIAFNSFWLVTHNSQKHLIGRKLTVETLSVCTPIDDKNWPMSAQEFRQLL